MNALELHRPRQWGACWLACQLWNLLDLDGFWIPRLPPSRKKTRWLNILKTLVSYRLISPGSEWRLHREWYQRSAMGDLLGEDLEVISKDKLYRCLDQLLPHKKELFSHLTQRWATLFQARFDILLYDLTSTYFESDPPGLIWPSSFPACYLPGRDGFPRVVGPGMFRVAAFQLLLHLLVAAVPEALQVLGDLNRPAGRGQEMEEHLDPARRDCRRVGQAEHLLQLYGQDGNFSGGVIQGYAVAARHGQGRGCALVRSRCCSRVKRRAGAAGDPGRQVVPGCGFPSGRA